ncbi:MAG TPA: nucleotidyltransferase family protein [Crinalium sp.]|jgi:hypothetical protein
MVDLKTILKTRLGTSYEDIIHFCQRWQITQFALFGSVLRDDFHSNSDIDVLVEFMPDHDWGLLEMVEMQGQLEVLFDRSVDLVSKQAIEHSHNWLRRKNILESARVIYGAGSIVFN